MQDNKETNGFTLVEVMVVIPVAILVVGTFVALIVSLTGDMLIANANNALVYSTQDALDTIESDTRLSTEFLPNSFTPVTPQGYGDATTVWNADGSGGQGQQALILGRLATDKNPAAQDRSLVYTNSPNSCASGSASKNAPFVYNSVYYIKGGSLWKRNLFSNYPNVLGGLCATPWQVPSCTPGASATVCKSDDVELVRNIQSFSITYIDSSTGDTVAPALADTINVTIGTSQTVAGRTITYTGSNRVAKLNLSVTPNDTIATYAISYTIDPDKPTSPVFTWDNLPTATSYDVQYNINGGSWINGPQNTTTRSFTVDAYHAQTVNLKITARNGSDTFPYGTTSAILPGFTDCSLQSGWVNYGSVYGNGGFTKTTDNIVLLRGLISNSTAAYGDILCTLPLGFRPSSRLIFQNNTRLSNGTSGSGRIDVLPDGSIVAMGTPGSWFGFDGVSFVEAGAGSWTTLTPLNTWTQYGSPYSDIKATLDNSGRVQVQGLAKEGTVTNGTDIANVPSGYSPSHFMFLPASSQANPNAVGVTASGAIESRGVTGGWRSLQFMYYPSAYAGWINLTLQNGWTEYNAATYSPAQYTKSSDGIVTVRGLIKGGTTTLGTTIATLPVGYRPTTQVLINGIMSPNAHARFDIDTSGNIKANVVNAAWTALDYVRFSVN